MAGVIVANISLHISPPVKIDRSYYDHPDTSTHLSHLSEPG